MQLNKATKEQPEINLTSLIDVVFLLLIFFMISTTFEQSSALQINLPESNEEPAEQRGNPVILAIDARGNMALNDRRLPSNDAETIHNALGDVRANIRRSTLVISADADTSHKYVVRVMDMAGQLGITNLSIATVHTEDSQ